MTEVNDFMDINISMSVERDLLDYRLIGKAMIKTPDGKTVEIVRSSDSFNFLHMEDRNMVVGYALNHLLCVIGRKIKDEFTFVGGVDSNDIQAVDVR
jgi:hypothetical protein